MSVDNSAASVAPGPQEPSAAARRLIRTALKASLGTLDRTSGHPYVSLVLVATEPDGTPLLLISRLALHTQNLGADGRASLLMMATAAWAIHDRQPSLLSLPCTPASNCEPNSQGPFLAPMSQPRHTQTFPTLHVRIRDYRLPLHRRLR